MATRESTGNQTVYQLKISLKDIRPPIWRRVLVNSSTTLQLLHLIIQEAMGWENYHMHKFSISGVDYGQAQQEPDFELDMLSEDSVLLSQVVDHEKFKFSYIYDFGDGWEHEILVEKKLPYSADRRYPVCITGRRACPPEDCGGPWRYPELLEIIKDPSHPDYEEQLEWLGEDFAPDVFDIDEVNQRLETCQ